MNINSNPNLKKDESCLAASFDYWNVEPEYYEHFINYLRFGWEPGSFFTAILANDCLSAFAKSHPNNTMVSLSDLARWIINVCPKEAYGSYAKVDAWTRLTNDERRAILEREKLVKSAWELLQTA
jgi:hypothetical protein